MRPALSQPSFKVSSLLSPFRQSHGLEHRFFLRRDEQGNEVDFQAPLDDGVTGSILHHLGAKRLLVPQQQHTSAVLIYPGKLGALAADGLLTQEKQVALLIRHADCQAALFWDPVQEVIGAVHAGFRGQAQFIYRKTIDLMQSHFGSLPQNIRVAISPSLGLNAAEFIHYKNEFPSQLHAFYKEGKMDLKAMAKAELIDKGILEKHLELSSECTFSNSDLFHSYRRDKTTKRLASVVMLR